MLRICLKINDRETFLFNFLAAAKVFISFRLNRERLLRWVSGIDAIDVRCFPLYT